MGIVIRQSIKGTVVNYIGVFIGFLTKMFIATKYLSAEDLGLTEVLLAAGLLLSNFAQMGTGVSAIRFFPYFKNEEKQNNGFFFYLMMVPLVGICIFVPVFLLLKEPICAYFETNSALLVDYYNWLIPFMCVLLYWNVFDTYSSLLRRIAIPKIIREILVKILLAGVYFIYAFEWVDLDGFIACYIAVYAIAMISTFIYVADIGTVSLKHNPAFIDKNLKKNFLSYTSIVLLGSLSGTLISRIDLFMVTSGIGLAAAGVYTIAFYMATVIEIPSRSITAISAPLAAESLMAGNLEQANELYKKVSLHQLLIGSAIFVLIWINIDNIYDIIPNGAAYKDGKWVVFFIGLSKLVEVTLGFGTNLISYSKYYHWGLYFVFFLGAITIVSNNVLIPIFGVSGAAIATTLTCLISYGIQQWLIFAKLKGNPYSRGTGKQVLIILALFGINYCLPVVQNAYLDCIYRSFVIISIGIPLIYFGKVSAEVNRIVNYTLSAILKK